MGCGPLILFDTHALVWLDQGMTRLGSRSRRMADEAIQDQALHVSAITFWEVAMLVRKNRVTLGGPLGKWRQSLFNFGVQEIQVDGSIGLAAGSLENLHGDPADRIIVASALSIGATLVTADETILAWRGEMPRQDARK